MISHHASQTLYESIPSMFLAPKGEPEKTRNKDSQYKRSK
jgi:hypothetical protein